jgi:type I restriction enzyme M protein
MLDTDTKRRIDSARDILVGKVPDPKSQVEQITIALIYKFMDDMDAEAEELGGKRKFFAGQFARYGWAKLMHAGLGGFETLNLYAEGITKMPENPGIPPLFRDIFKNAYLPYRDPETLKMFLKTIDGFTYEHSERLGDAFEYLLSVLGSQGDAGQFRTPRHIIDFIVAIVDPKKNETILDPACGTAGFLISSYKHILAANRANMDRQDGQDEREGPEAANMDRQDGQDEREGPETANMDRQDGQDKTGESGASRPSMFSTLTPDERGRLANNLKGYDISPDMVRLSLVNMYLHGFAEPHIYEYDTLASLDKWNEYADVILANPPFMSPKGGIMPHNRFSVQSKRSEVLFVDYMAEHLTPTGRAGIIVPEGVIFQSGTAYKQLRKMLVEGYLVAVVSLPAGVFNPYSGVKTSILILDKSRAKRARGIGFFKVENDGFGLGAQRREIEKNDLPAVARAVSEFLNMDTQDRQDTEGASCESYASMLETLAARGLALIVPKAKIAANGEYNLSGERYGAVVATSASFPFISLGEVCEIAKGSSITRDQVVDGSIPVIAGGQKPSCFHNQWNRTGETITVSASGAYSGFVAYFDEPIFASDCSTIKASDPRLLTRFLFHLLKAKQDRIYALQIGMAQPHVYPKDLARFQIPLPPLVIQKEIVAEIEGYQKVIDGARAVVDNYRPHIPIRPEWPLVALGDVCQVKGGKRLPLGEPFSPVPTSHPYIRVSDFRELSVDTSNLKFISEEVHQQIARYTISASDVYISIAGTIGLMGTVPEDLNGANLTENAAKLVFDTREIDGRFLCVAGRGDAVQSQIRSLTHAVGVPKLALERIKTLTIPLPPLATQQAIVAEIEAEQALVAANRALIVRMEKKIQGVLARVWGEQS